MPQKKTKMKYAAKNAAAKWTNATKAYRLDGSVVAEIMAGFAELKALIREGKSPKRNWRRKFKGPKTPMMDDMLSGFEKYIKGKALSKDDTKEIRRLANRYWLENKCSRLKSRSGSKKGYGSFKAFANACCTRVKAKSVAMANSRAA